MVLNYIWIGFFLIAFVVALFKLLVFGDMTIFPNIMNSTFEYAKVGFELSLGLTGVMTLWLGVMKIGENGGAIKLLSKGISPLFNKLFPEIPKNKEIKMKHVGKMKNNSARVAIIYRTLPSYFSR